MDFVRRSSSAVVVILSLALLLSAGQGAGAQAPAAQPVRPSLAPLISLAEARVIIDGAKAFARDGNMRAAVVVVDAAGNPVPGRYHGRRQVPARPQGRRRQGVRGGDLPRAHARASSPGRRAPTGISTANMYAGKVYLVGGGVPLAVDGKLVGAVGVAGLPEFVDEKAARAGIAAWDKFRAAAK